MKSYFLIVIFSVIISCKSKDNSNKKFDIINNKGNVDVYNSGEKFETKESNKFNTEGIELAKKNEFNKAEIKFLKALKLEPNNPTILNNLGNIKKSKYEYDESINYYEKSLIVSDSLYFNSALNLGIVSYKIKNYNKSLKLLEYVTSESTDLKLIKIAYYNLALVYIAMNECDKAKTELKKMKKLFENNIQFIEQYEYLETRIKNCAQHRV